MKVLNFFLAIPKTPKKINFNFKQNKYQTQTLESKP